jgi:hypothetical protein
MVAIAPMQAHAMPNLKQLRPLVTLKPCTLEWVRASNTATDDKMHCQQTDGDS